MHDANLLESQVMEMCRKYNYEEAHCQRVASLAGQLFDQLADVHGLGQTEAMMLRHAALLHDIGHFIRYQGHHKHSAYLIANDSSLVGYPKADREMLATIAINHRKRPKGAPKSFSSARSRVAEQLGALLRLADGLDHDRAGSAVVQSCSTGPKQITILVDGVNPNLATVLKEKSEMMKSAFGRRVLLTTETEPQAEAISEPSGEAE